MDRQGRLLIAAYDDIIRYDGRSFVPLNKGEGLESWYAFDVLEDRHGDIWIASDQSGVFRVDGDTGAVSRFTTDDGIGNRRNMCVYEDRAGNIWIGGQGGLTRFDGTTFRNFTVADGLPHNDINTVLEDRHGNLWFGTRGNAGIYDGVRFHELRNGENQPFFNVWSILEDRSGDIWLIDREGLWRFHGGVCTHETADVWKVYEDAEGAFWFTGMLAGGTSSLMRAESKDATGGDWVLPEVFHSPTMLFGLVQDPQGVLWIGGGDGIWSYDGATARYHTGVETGQ
ncbi:MAG: two-component regulator propeller domain-containing protein [Planctomycetota bacterium]